MKQILKFITLVMNLGVHLVISPELAGVWSTVCRRWGRLSDCKRSLRRRSQLYKTHVVTFGVLVFNGFPETFILFRGQRAARGVGDWTSYQ